MSRIKVIVIGPGAHMLCLHELQATGAILISSEDLDSIVTRQSVEDQLEELARIEAEKMERQAKLVECMAIEKMEYEALAEDPILHPHQWEIGQPRAQERPRRSVCTIRVRGPPRHLPEISG